MAESRNTSKLVKCRHYGRIFITHLFSHIGLCGLVVGYAIVGAFTFESLEAPNELDQRSTIQTYRKECLMDLWNITLNLNVLYEENWTTLIGARLKLFEQEVVNAVKNEGYDGKETSDSELQWSFSGALLYCITVITTIGLCGLVVGYAIIGAFTFEFLEVSNELNERSIIQAHRKNCLMDLWNITLNFDVLYDENWIMLIGDRLKWFERELVNAVKNEGYDGKEANDSDLQWSFSGSLLYSITIITTIGYGNIAPKTDVGKVVTIFYALLGIPLMLLCLTNIGDLLARSFKFTYSHVCFLFRNPRRTHAAPSPKHQLGDPNKSPISKIAEVATLEMCNGDEKTPTGASSLPSSPLGKPPQLANNLMMVPEATPVVIERVYRDSIGAEDQRVPMYMVLLLVTGYICGGAVLFSLWENWTFLDGAYFCFITLSTIGFGDLVPGSDIFDAQSGQAKLIICCIYLITGLAIIAMSFNLVQEEVIIKCRNLARNLGLLKSEHDYDDD